MPTGAQRFTRQQIDRATSPDAPGLAQATITAVSADTIPIVTVEYLGGFCQFPHLLQYTPVVGHVVAMAPYAGSWLILGRPGGFPT